MVKSRSVGNDNWRGWSVGILKVGVCGVVGIGSSLWFAMACWRDVSGVTGGLCWMSQLLLRVVVVAVSVLMELSEFGGGGCWSDGDVGGDVSCGVR